jgi:hypothetical protein
MFFPFYLKHPDDFPLKIWLPNPKLLESLCFSIIGNSVIWGTSWNYFSLFFPLYRTWPLERLISLENKSVTRQDRRF